MIITFDLETTNHDYGSALHKDNHIVMLCWQVDDGPIRSHHGPLFLAKDFIKAYEEADVACAFNAKFEMLWLIRTGLDINKPWHDPMLAERVLQGNKQLPMNLGAIAGRYGFDTKDPVIDSMMKSGICPSDMPRKRLLARCVRDVRTTRQIMKRQLDELRKREQLHIYRTRVDFCSVLARIEWEGMLLDRERVHEAYYQYAVQEADLKHALDEITGGINLRSPDQLAKFLYAELEFPERKNAQGKPMRNKPSKQFPNGRPKTDKDTMLWLEQQAETRRQQEFVEKRQAYGKANAALTKNLEFFKGVVDESPGRTFYAQFNQTVAATHRLTSSGKPVKFEQFDRPKSVQFQNMPREFKHLFCAPDGYKIVEVDASQLEFRVAAFLGQDEQAMKDIADPDFDAHCTSAAIMNGVDYEQFLKYYRMGDKNYAKLRTAAKADTFKPLFGGTKGTEKQERWYQEFQRRYSGIYSEQESWVAEVSREGELRLPWGMRFYWDAHTSRNGVLVDNKTRRPVGPQIFNYPVQSLATAEIVPIAILSLVRRCREQELDVRFVNTVHDSVICYVRDDETTITAFTRAAQQAFTTDVYEHLALHYGIDFNVPLGCGITFGNHWGEGDEITYDDVTNWKEKAA